MSGTVLRGKGTIAQFRALDWLRKADPVYYTARDDEWDAGEFVKRAVFVALTGQHAPRSHEDDEDWTVWALRSVIATDESMPHMHSVNQLIQRLEDMMEARSLAYTARTEGQGQLRIFSRRQWPQKDDHIGIHVGGGYSGMPKKYYGTMTFHERWQDADYSPLQGWLNKLKPLAEMMQKMTTGDEQRRNLASYKDTVTRQKAHLQTLQGHKDEWQAQEAEVMAWWKAKPDGLVANHPFNINLEEEWGYRQVIYYLLGRNPWQYQADYAQQQITQYEGFMRDRAPQDDFINREAVVTAWNDTVKAMADWSLDKEGGEEE